MNSEAFTAACIQASASDDADSSLAQVAELVRQAAASGARLIITPENSGGMVKDRQRQLALARPMDDHPGIRLFASLARQTGCWLLIGSLAVRVAHPQTPVANRSLLFSPDGRIKARYDKIHLFDADVASGESHRESRTFRAGDQAVVAATPFGLLGLTICYDLRFPQLFRALARAGASLISAPAAFTRPTGKAHWRVLVRARAIENGAFIFAAAQCGQHHGGRQTWGHSLIVNPWGEVCAEAFDDVGFITASVDPRLAADARRRIPCLLHDRDFAAPPSLTAASM